MDSWRDDQDEDGDAEEELRDVSFGGKDAVLFLIDASPKMLQTVGNVDGESPFQMCLRCVHSTLRSKIFASPTDVVGVLFFGTRSLIDSRGPML
jgi:ATP-dependent DNA helicase 2 subunit 1